MFINLSVSQCDFINERKAAMIKEYTEYEAIHLAMREGLTDGSELLTKTYERLGYLRNDCILDAFIEKLKQGYETVELKLNPKSNKGKGDRPYAGKKRIYIIGDKRDTFTEREDKRKYNKGKPLSNETQLLYDISQQKLFHLSSIDEDYTIGHWAHLLQFGKYVTTKSSEGFKRLVSVIRATYSLYYDTDFFSAERVVYEFARHYNKSVNNFIRAMFKRLDSESKLTHTVFYKGRTSSNKEIEISKEIHDNFLDDRRNIMEDHGYHYRLYSRLAVEWENFKAMNDSSKKKFSVTKLESLQQFGELYEIVHKRLLQRYGVHYVYTTHRIENVQPIEIINETTVSLQKMYYDKEYLARRKRYNLEENADSFRNSTFFYRRFFYLTASILLNLPDNEQLSSFEEDLREYVGRFDREFKYKNIEEFEWSKNSGIELECSQRAAWFDQRELYLQEQQREAIELDLRNDPLIVNSELVDSHEIFL